MSEEERWKYEIGTGKTPVAASGIMLAVFGALTIWLYRIKNGAFIFTGVMSAILALLVVLTLYRLCFYRIKIGRDEFFFQTNHWNGKMYRYTRLKKAWTSAGREQNGYQSQYCNVDTGNGAVIRFPFYYADEKAVRYLLDRVCKCAGTETNVNGKTDQEYIIDGKVFGKSRILIACVLLLVVLLFNGIAAGFLAQGETMQLYAKNALLFVHFASAMMAAAIAVLIFRYLSFQVKIEMKGFFVRTMPWNGTDYEYREITDCREIEKIVRHRNAGRHISGRTYYYYFEFTDIRGKKRKFQFEKPLYGHEIDVLKQRIEKQNKFGGDNSGKFGYKK